MRRVKVLFDFAFIVCLLQRPLLAQEAVETTSDSVSQASARERARMYFDRGVVAYRDGQFESARTSFEAALAVYQSPVFIFNLARTFEKLARPSRALKYYYDYLRLAPDAKDQAEVKARIGALETDLRFRGAKEVSIETVPTGANVTIDAHFVGTSPFVGDLSEGSHVISLGMPGYVDQLVTIAISGIEAVDFVYAMQPAPIPQREPREASRPIAVGFVRLKADMLTVAQPDLSHSASNRIGTWTYVTLGASVAALAGAGVLEVLRRRSEADVRELEVQRDRVAAYETMGDYQTSARVAAGAGTALAVLGTTLLAIDVTSHRARPTAMGGSIRVGFAQISMGGCW